MGHAVSQGRLDARRAGRRHGGHHDRQRGVTQAQFLDQGNGDQGFADGNGVDPDGFLEGKWVKPRTFPNSLPVSRIAPRAPQKAQQDQRDKQIKRGAINIAVSACNAAPSSKLPKIHSWICRLVAADRSRKRMPHCPEKVDQITCPRASTRSLG